MHYVKEKLLYLNPLMGNDFWRENCYFFQKLPKSILETCFRFWKLFWKVKFNS